MKVFYFITKSEQGGAQTHVAQLTEYLLSHGHQVAVMSAPGGWLEDEVKRLGGQFLSNPFLDNTMNPWKLWRAGRQFFKVVGDVKPDIVACHSTIAGLVGRFALRGRIPTVFTAHGWGFTHGTSFIRRILLIPLERIAGFFAARIICVSQNDVDLAKRHAIAPEKKIVKINNGVALLPSKKRDHNKKRLEIAFIGRLAPPKDPFLLVGAVKRIPAALQEKIHVSIIGDGQLRHNLQLYIKSLLLEDRVALLGALSREGVLSFLCENADIFVLMSRFEGFPYTVLEAMAAGIPVVATDVGGVKEAAGDDAGIIITPNDGDALRQALTTLIQDPLLREKQGISGRLRVERYFSVDAMCTKTIELYQTVLSEKRIHYAR